MQIHILLSTHLLLSQYSFSCMSSNHCCPCCFVPAPIEMLIYNLFSIGNCVWTKVYTFIVLCDTPLCWKANWFFHHFICHLPKELLMSSNWNDNGVLYQHLHSLLTVCLSSQTWSFHQRQSLSTPMGPYTPQYLCPLRAPALDLVQSSTAQALCCRMTQPPPIL